MKSSDYWRKREEQHIAQTIKDEKQMKKAIADRFQVAIDNINKEIDANWSRFAGKEGVSLSEAKKTSMGMDVESFARKAKQYVKDKDFSKTANEELRLYNVTMRVNRLELLKSQVGLELIALSDDLDKYTADLLTKEGLAEATRQAGILGETIFDGYKDFVESVVNGSFHSATFSQRIWGNTQAFKADLDKLLVQTVTQGKNPRDMARKLRNLYDSKKYEAERLMRTESARVQTEIQKQSYKKYDIEDYEFVAEPNACPICAALNGKVFKVKDMSAGINACPMHANCRCSTAPYVERGKASSESNDFKDVFDKTNMSSAVGKENYRKFLESLDSIDDERVRAILNKFGSQLEFNKLSDTGNYAQGGKIQLSQKAFDGSNSKKAMQTVLHELGHAIDNLGIGVLGSDFDRVSEISKYKLKNDIKKDMLNLFNSDLKAANGNNYATIKNFKKMSIFDQSTIIRKYKKLAEEHPQKYSSLSDLMESTGGFIDHPLGSGHGLKYWKISGKQESEFFAHMTEAVVNEESRKMMYELFPTASKKWEQMLEDILKAVK